jgi:two-component system, NarL family, sensor kinase
MIKNFILVILFLCFPFDLMSQGIDSLWKNNPSISDSLKLDILGNKCWELLYNDTAKLRQVCDEMLKLTPNADNIYAKIQSYRTAGTVYQVLQDYSKSIQYYSLAVSTCQQTRDSIGRKLYGFTLTNFGSLYLKNGDYQTALKVLLKADSLLQPFDADVYRINIYSKIANVYSLLNQNEQYTYYYKKIIKLAEKTGDTLSIITSDAFYAQYKIEQGNYTEAEKSLKHALKLSIEFRNPNYIFNSYYYLGSFEFGRQNYQKAIDYYRKSQEVATQSGDFYSICLSLKELGSIYKETGHFREAQKTITACIALAREHDFTNLLMNTLAVAIPVEDTLGNYKQALTYNKEYDTLLQRITDLEVRKSVSFLEAKYQAEKRENDINKLEAVKKVQAIKLSRNRLWILILIAITLLLAISSLLIFLSLRYKKKIIQQENEIQKQKISELEKDKLLTATHAVIRGEEAERTRLARDLHDGLGGLLSGIRLKLTGLKGNFIVSEQSVEQFDKTLHLLDNSITELRRVAHNMMPEVLIKFGLKDALRDFCQQLQDGKNLKITFRFFGEEGPVDNAVKISTYRIAQELVNNVIKHANATEAIVQLVQDEKRIHLTVQDNGVGMSDTGNEIRNGAGLFNIKARVASHNGRLEIDAKPGEGTEISVEFLSENN